MKFFDDINIEKLNSLLKFKTRDNNFKIKGSIELYTMKNTIKEKKTVIKRINDFLDEKYKETFINSEIMKQQEQKNEEGLNGIKAGNINGIRENNDFDRDFYEQKRRLSVTSDYYSNINGGNGSFVDPEEGNDAQEKTNIRRQSSSSSLPLNKKRRSSSSSYSMKLNNDNLNKIINDTEYFMKMRQQQNGSKSKPSQHSGSKGTEVAESERIDEEQSDFKNFDFQMGPFGNISDPQARKLFSQIIMILNSAFQDHDFVKIISPLDFKELSMDTWQAEFNNIINNEVTGIKTLKANAESSGEHMHGGENDSKENSDKEEKHDDDAFVPPNTEKLTGFNSDSVWKILNNKIDLDSCFKILEYSPFTKDNIEEQAQYNKVINETQQEESNNNSNNGQKDSTEMEDEIKIDHPQINKKDFLKDELATTDGLYVWSKLWFLINKKMKRVAFIYVICSRTVGDQEDMSDEGQYYLDDEDAVILSSDEEEGSASKGVELVNSEYNEDYDDDYDDDLDYAVESDDESE